MRNGQGSRVAQRQGCSKWHILFRGRQATRNRRRLRTRLVIDDEDNPLALLDLRVRTVHGLVAALDPTGSPTMGVGDGAELLEEVCVADRARLALTPRRQCDVGMTGVASRQQTIRFRHDE